MVLPGESLAKYSPSEAGGANEVEAAKINSQPEPQNTEPRLRLPKAPPPLRNQPLPRCRRPNPLCLKSIRSPGSVPWLRGSTRRRNQKMKLSNAQPLRLKLKLSR